MSLLVTLGLIKCKHPAERLAVQKFHTVKDNAKYPGEFTEYTYHLHCQCCGEQVDVSFAQPHYDKIDAALTKDK